ncbi:MAG: hypothetical protein AABW48_00565 [Nanoarchaeota archaeon]
MSSSPYRTPQPIDVEIADLEGRVDLTLPSTYLKTEVIIPVEGKSILYVGEALDLKVSSQHNECDSIEGQVSLSRYNRVEKLERTFKWFPPRYQVQSSLKDDRIWKIDRFAFFVWDGKFKPEYRNILKKEALNKGITVSDKLIELVFGPIDTEIMEMYQELQRKLTFTKSF